MNRKKFFSKLGVKETDVVSALLDHSNHILPVSSRSFRFPKADALITQEKGVFLSVNAADCYPVLFYDPIRQIVSSVHAGWQGAVSGLIPKVIAYNLIKGSYLADIRVEIGPGICVSHFEFSEEHLDRLGKYNDSRYFFCGKGGKVNVDIKKILLSEITRQGVPERNIKFHPECTYCLPEKYFSYRRDGKNSEGQINAMLVLFGMKENKNKKGELIPAENECLAFA